MIRWYACTTLNQCTWSWRYMCTCICTYVALVLFYHHISDSISIYNVFQDLHEKLQYCRCSISCCKIKLWWWWHLKVLLTWNTFNMKYFHWSHTFRIKWVLLYMSLWCVGQSWVISCRYACRWYHRHYSLPPACSLERKLKKNFVETQSSTKFLLLHSLAQYNKWSGKQHAQDMGVGCHSNGWYSYGKGGCCRMCATSTSPPDWAPLSEPGSDPA